MIPRDDPRRGRVMIRGELLDAGYNDKAIARLVRNRTWVKVRHGAYSEMHTWTRLEPADQHALRARAVALQARTPVVVSHVSGLPYYGAPVWGLDLADVHVTRADGQAGRCEAGVDQHSGAIHTGDVIQVDGLPVMSPTRLALETTMVAPVEPSLAVVNHLIHHGATSLEQLRARYELGMTQWPGSLTTDLVLRLADARIESIGETRGFHLFFRHGLPMPVPQYEITDPSGRVVARVDFAWPELGVFVEFDGRVKYEKLLKPGQRASDVVVAEKQREELVCRLTGWRCIRMTWADLEHPERIVAILREALVPRAQAS
jgi:hypothetical protein